jgi:hypothetical protein
MRNSLPAIAGIILACCIAQVAFAAEPIEIGSRLELFVDHYLIDGLTGEAELHLHKPVPREVVLVTDKPWEGNTSAYYSVFQDGDLYRMYYRGSHYDKKTRRVTHPEVTCYAESKDGIHWTKPELGLFEFEGSKNNNIVWNGIGTHCFTPFKDLKADCPPEARYKAIARGRPRGKRGLYAFQSPDGIRWSLMKDGPVITLGAFDSQNLAFWDPHTKLYREYHRTFTEGVRAIMTGTSKDFITWSKPVLLEYTGTPKAQLKQHLYTNAVLFYERAPHILIGFPTRFLTKEGSRVEPTFMASRDGRTFHRWLEALIPEDAPKDRSGNRSNYMTWGLVKLPSNDKEYSVYATEAYYTGPDSRVRRFTFRLDGFVSARAPAGGGELLTKPLAFAGKKLAVNFATSNFSTSQEGCLRVEIQDADGRPIDGFGLSDCLPISGDAIEQTIAWKNGDDVSRLAGKPIRLRFQLKSADLYSFRFGM